MTPFEREQLKSWLFRRTRPENGCIVWDRAIHKRGYGKVKYKGKSYYVHKLSYIAFSGEVPEGLQVDHLCFNKICIKREHLEAVTGEENRRRWYEKFLKDNPNFPCGHPRDGDVLVYKDMSYKSGTTKYQQRCRPCWKKYQKEYHAK